MLNIGLVHLPLSTRVVEPRSADTRAGILGVCLGHQEQPGTRLHLGLRMNPGFQAGFVVVARLGAARVTEAVDGGPLRAVARVAADVLDTDLHAVGEALAGNSASATK